MGPFLAGLAAIGVNAATIGIAAGATYVAQRPSKPQAPPPPQAPPNAQGAPPSGVAPRRYGFGSYATIAQPAASQAGPSVVARGRGYEVIQAPPASAPSSSAPATPAATPPANMASDDAAKRFALLELDDKRPETAALPPRPEKP